MKIPSQSISRPKATDAWRVALVLIAASTQCLKAGDVTLGLGSPPLINPGTYGSGASNRFFRVRMVALP